MSNILPFSAPLVEVKDLSFRFKDSSQWSLEEVSFRLMPDDFLLILGPNGGGKTTLIRLLLGLLKPQQGEVRILGRPPKLALAKIGYVPQTFTGESHFQIRVIDVVTMGDKASGPIPRYFSPILREKAEFWLERVGLQGLGQVGFGSLSGGQRQKVLLARAMMAEPVLLILDEPTNHVDVSGKIDICKLLAEFAQKSAVIMVSHDLSAIPKGVNLIGCVDRKLVIHGDLQSPHYHSPHHSSAAVCLVDFLAEQTAPDQFYQTLMNSKAQP